ncbi:hypothetical protein BDQ17DRAFT_464119 [Cyathus striatus]|nr:hypothetical protein BDQ17DRAFT_464119 [Cyathus striatus]
MLAGPSHVFERCICRCDLLIFSACTLNHIVTSVMRLRDWISRFTFSLYCIFTTFQPVLYSHANSFVRRLQHNGHSLSRTTLRPPRSPANALLGNSRLVSHPRDFLLPNDLRPALRYTTASLCYSYSLLPLTRLGIREAAGAEVKNPEAHARGRKGGCMGGCRSEQSFRAGPNPANRDRRGTHTTDILPMVPMSCSFGLELIEATCDADHVLA